MLKKIFPLKKINFKNFSAKANLDLIKVLRAETNSPLNHIKKALEETENNLEDAKIWLRKKGFKDAENRMTRSANTKLIGIKSFSNHVAISSLSCETDFVAGTDIFKYYSQVLIDFLVNYGKSVDHNDFSSLKLDEYVKNLDPQFKYMSILDGLKHVISKTQENCRIGDFNVFNYSPGDIIGVYLHSPVSNDLGFKGSYVVLSGDKINNEYKSFADKLAMQVVASKAKYLNKADIPENVLSHEEKIFKEAAISEGKKENILDKVVKAKIESFYEEVVLNEQQYVIIDYDEDIGKLKVNQIVSKKGKELGCEDLKIKDFKLIL